jgi:hypothetical protein
MGDSWWRKWFCDRFSLQYFGFTLSVSFPQSSILNFIYVLLLPEGQWAKPGNLPKSNVLLEMEEHGI